MAKRYNERIKADSVALKGGGEAHGGRLPMTIAEFYNADYPYGENRQMDVFRTAGRHWFVPKSPRLMLEGGWKEGEGSRPSKYQILSVEGRCYAAIRNVDITFLSDMNYYMICVAFGYFSEDDPWNEGINKAEAIIKAAVGYYVEVDDEGWVNFTNEEDMLKAIDAFIAEGAEDALRDIV